MKPQSVIPPHIAVCSQLNQQGYTMTTRRKLKANKPPKEAPLCACGCGRFVTLNKRTKKFNQYIRGHTAARDGPKPKGKAKPRGMNGGCKTGSRNKVSLAADNIFDGESESLSRQAIDMALSGDRVMLKLCIDRVCPVKRSTPIKLPGLPKVKATKDLSKLTGFLLESVGSGKLSATDAEVLSRVVDKHSHALKLCDLAHRLQEVEELLSKNAECN